MASKDVMSMKLEDQVCALEYSKRLVELGVKPISLFNWTRYEHRVEYSVNYLALLFYNNFSEIYPAFTVAELGEMLPNSVALVGAEPFENYRISIAKFHSVNEERIATNNYIVNYLCDTVCADGTAMFQTRLIKNIYDPNLANAMAKMLIYLIENKLIEVPA